jgi:hypothetical protein
MNERKRFHEQMIYMAPHGFTKLVDKLAVLNGTSRSEIQRQAVRALARAHGVSVQFEPEPQRERVRA